ncbi:MAG: bifunctional (p)ppGpp synthetase/guanosine-3',5'-bis(diphosphate) 3'-pyrophosphohydrolase [Firmicutes bacterium]|nr:bifunctional (p)ppGpp synthetase/guanosine-3',5'-bis(diphosphate) 3'-pyrophosphohydrolase [Bacillota bacterium]
MTIEDLLQKAEKYPPEAREEIRRAYAFAASAHQGQRRDSGEAYINHPLAVANILVEMGLDPTSVIAALLHDVVEDTEIGLEEIAGKFGEEVAALVDGLTKLSKIVFQNKQEQQVENLRKMFLAMAKDVRVILIKLADRMHNMRTLRFLPVERRKRIARETLEIYAPLAHRLGMYRMKWELEDIAFHYLEPEKYYELVQKVAQKRSEREREIEENIKVLADHLAELNIKADIQGRPKHFYSVYQKMVKQNKDFSEIYDLMALRVLVDTIQDCYEVLGVVHTLWKPIPGRFKDYIAVPKSNLYQSLHTTVMGNQGAPLEIQIRTWQMHQVAEYGIAAHWRYKEGKTVKDEDFLQKIAWLRHLLEWQGEANDADEFLENLRVNLFEDEVFVFTPKGDVKSLPAGATPGDFAYTVHTHIGHRCVGAKVNGRLVPLDHQLKNGDIVQILTAKQDAGPSRDWLKFVVTSKAKSRIRQWLREQSREEYILLAREQLERELKKNGYDPQSLLKPELLQEVASRLGFVQGDDLLFAVGDGKLACGAVAAKLVAAVEPEKKQPPILPGERPLGRPGGVKVEGVSNLLVRFSRCCNPVPGDQIIGYITRGKGVAVHRVDCPSLPTETERFIRVEWDQEETGVYPLTIEVEALDRNNLLLDIMNVFSQLKLNVSAVNVRTNKGLAYLDFTVEVRHLNEAQELVRKLQLINGVQKVFRTTKARKR